MVKEVKRMHEKGRPVLVGTTSVEQSEDLSSKLKEIGKKFCIASGEGEGRGGGGGGGGNIVHL